MVEFDDRREYFRITVNCEIDCRLLETDETHQARCTTLSGSGISFVTHLALQPEMELEITIQSQLPLTPPMRVHAKVIRVNRIDEKTYEIGASTTVLQDDDYLSL
jgi:c-di-GMP-binding flagellar brake protein YcgR